MRCKVYFQSNDEKLSLDGLELSILTILNNVSENLAFVVVSHNHLMFSFWMKWCCRHCINSPWTAAHLDHIDLGPWLTDSISFAI